MKYLITGATGFIGNHLINELLKDKSNQIIATSRSKQKAILFDWYKKVRYVEHTIDSNNSDINLYNLFDKPDYLIHLAWGNLPNYNSLTHIEDNIYSNYYFIKNLVKNGLLNISISGTCAEYGMINGRLSEDINTNPINSYAIAKDTLRKLIEELNKNYKFSFKWMRLFYMYGKGQSDSSLLSLVDKAIQNNESIFNMSKAEQLRDYLHISKVVSIIARLAKSDNAQGVINCCSGKPISVRNLVEQYLKEKNYHIELNLGYYPYPNYEPMAFWGDDTKMKQALGE